jgi:hypothetical protein
MRLTRRSAVATLVAGITLAACSGGSAPTATPSTNAPTSRSRQVPTTVHHAASVDASAAACTFITKADASAVFGHVASAKPNDMAQPGDNTCTWGATVPDPGQPDNLDYSLITSIYPGASMYDEVQFPDAVAVQGIGEKAKLHPAGPGADLWFVRNGETYEVSYGVVGFGADAATHGTTDAKLEALVREAVARA